MNEILRDCSALCAEIDRAIGSKAETLRQRLKAERDAYAATIPARVRSWNSPEGERVAKMKARLVNLDGLISRLDDIESITEILAEDILRLKSE